MAYEPIPQKAEDVAHANADAGVPILAVRREADSSSVGTDGDYENLHTNGFGRLKVSTQPAAIGATVDTITANADTVVVDVNRASSLLMYCTGTFSTINCTFEASIDGGTTWFGIMAARTNANTVELTTGNLSAAPAYAWRMNVTAYTNVRVRATAFTSGTQTWTCLPGVYATEPAPVIPTHAVTGSGNFAVTMAASATGSPAKAEDAAHASGDVGVLALAVRNDANTALSGADGDYTPIGTDSQGNVRVIGEVAHDAVDAGRPIKIGGQARTTNPGAVADADRSNFITDKLGKQVVVGSVRDLKGDQATTLTSTVTETTIVTAVAATFLDLYGLIVTNISATACEVIFRDVTAGTPRFSIMVPAGETRGFMLNESAAYKQATVNTAWTAQCGTSVASIKINALYVRNI